MEGAQEEGCWSLLRADPLTQMVGLEELEAKVRGVASWMNAGRTLSGRTEQQAEGKI